jgi:hypothetical protein
MWDRSESFTVMVMTRKARNLSSSMSIGTAGDAGVDIDVDACVDTSVGSETPAVEVECSWLITSEDDAQMLEDESAVEIRFGSTTFQSLSPYTLSPCNRVLILNDQMA